jgi:hypothetical protein
MQCLNTKEDLDFLSLVAFHHQIELPTLGVDGLAFHNHIGKCNSDGIREGRVAALRPTVLFEQRKSSVHKIYFRSAVTDQNSGA